MSERKCCACRVVKPLDAFNRNRSKKSGYADQCRVCNAAYLRDWAEKNRERKRQMDRDYAAANRERAALKTREWAAANPERKRATDRAYVAANKERLASQSANYRAENREKILAQKAKYAAENRDRLLTKQRAWKAANKAKVLANVTLRKMRKRKATPAWLTSEQRLQMRQAYELAEIYSEHLGEQYHVDHIVPISSPLVCGLHVPWNLQVITARENIRKSNSF